MELDQKLGMSLDQLMKSDRDTKKAVRSTRLRGRRPRAKKPSDKMDISDSAKKSVPPKKPVASTKKAATVSKKPKAVVSKKAISKDVDMRGDSQSRRARRKASDDGIEKIEKSSSRVILKSKKQVAAASSKTESAERRTVKISNIPYDVHWRDVKDAFARLVPVDRCDVDKGVATIVFKSRTDAQRAIDTYNGGNMNGRIIKAAFA